MVPRREWNLRLRGSAVDRDVDVCYDILRGRFVDWSCESCDRELGSEAYLCGCEGIVCPSCYFRCPSCGREVCRECAEARCHVCGGIACEICGAACPLESEAFQADLPSVCLQCREEYCPGCVKGVAFHLENTFLP